MLLASVRLLILGKVVHFREVRIWPWVFDCFLCVAVCRQACYITSAFNRIHTARFSGKEMSPPAIWNTLILRTVANPLRGSVRLSVTTWRLWEGGRGSCVSGAPRGSWQAPSSLGAGIPLPFLGWEAGSTVEQRTNRLSVFLTSVVFYQALIKDIHPPTKWINERLIDDSEVYLFELLFICSYATAPWNYGKWSNSAPYRYESVRGQHICCNMLITFKTIREELHGLSFLTGGVYSDFPLEYSWIIIAFLY